MSDFNRNNDPAYRPVDPQIDDPYAADPIRRPVVVEERSTSAGMVVGALLLAAIALGGYYAYNHSNGIRTALNDTPTTSSTAPMPSAPAAIPDNATRPAMPSTPPATTPAQ